jgi:hypothetical protein
MSANDNLERRIADYYETEAPPRAPDWVLQSTLDTVNDTQQRRVIIRAPRRFPEMNSFAKLAVAAVIVIAVGAVGWRMLGPSSPSGVGGQPAASPSPTPSPSLTSSPDPSAPPPLGGTFTSSLNGVSMSYPTGWVTAPATEPWTGSVQLDFHSPTIDHIYDPVLQDHLFLDVASQPLAGKAGDAWVTYLVTDPNEGCDSATPTEPITVAGARGRICGTLVALSIQDRGYFIRLYTSGDEPWLESYYDQAWFRTVLDTVQLHPENAVDTAPSPSP